MKLAWKIVILGMFLISLSGCSDSSERGSSSESSASFDQEKQKPQWQKPLSQVPNTSDDKWKKADIVLPSGLGKLEFWRKPAHEFLSEYDRIVVVVSPGGKSQAYELPPNTGWRTNMEVYLVEEAFQTTVWLWEKPPEMVSSQYIFNMRDLSFHIEGEDKYWRPDIRGCRGSWPVKLPDHALLIGNISAKEGKPVFIPTRKNVAAQR